MRILRINASGWRSATDFYVGLLEPLGAPEWHGLNVNALIDSLLYGDINAVEPPLRIEITNIQHTAVEALSEMRIALGALAAEGATCVLDAHIASVEVPARARLPGIWQSRS